MPIAVVATLVFIFSNSLSSGESSSEQSGTIVKAVQAAAGVFAPHSFVATATGEELERLNRIVRVLAHFCEFALLGALFIWTYFAYTREKRWLYLPVCAFLLVPITDECLQLYASARAAELADVCVDLLGGACGMAFAAVTLLIGAWICSRRERKKGIKKQQNK